MKPREELNLQSLVQRLKKTVDAIYLFYGEESFLVEDAVQRVVSTALGEGLKDFNYDVFSLDRAEMARVRDAIETLPMMTERRVVVLRELESIRENAAESLLELIKDPVTTTTVVFTAGKLDKRKKLVRTLLEKSVAIEMRSPQPFELPSWVQYIARGLDLELGDVEIQLLHDMVGGNLRDLQSELQKLKSYLGERKKVETADILAVVSRLRSDSVFDLADAIGRNDRVKALVCLANLLDHGENEIGILSLVSRHVRILRNIKEAQQRGIQGSRLSTVVGVPNYFLRNYMDQLKLWPEHKMDKTLQALLDTDRALKSAPVSSHIWLENFVLKTCQ